MIWRSVLVGTACGLLLLLVVNLQREVQRPSAMTNQEYGQKMGRVMTELSAINRVVVQASTALGQDAASTASARSTFVQCQNRLGGFQRELHALIPPTGLQSIHQTILAALDHSAQACQQLQRGLDTHNAALFTEAASSEHVANTLFERAINELPE